MNHEGYRDDTADRAISHVKTRVENYDDPVIEDVTEAVSICKKIFRKYDLEVVGRIHLKSKKNGKVYK